MLMLVQRQHNLRNGNVHITSSLKRPTSPKDTQPQELTSIIQQFPNHQKRYEEGHSLVYSDCYFSGCLFQDQFCEDQDQVSDEMNEQGSLHIMAENKHQKLQAGYEEESFNKEKFVVEPLAHVDFPLEIEL